MSLIVILYNLQSYGEKTNIQNKESQKIGRVAKTLKIKG